MSNIETKHAPASIDGHDFTAEGRREFWAQLRRMSSSKWIPTREQYWSSAWYPGRGNAHRRLGSSVGGDE